MIIYVYLCIYDYNNIHSSMQSYNLIYDHTYIINKAGEQWLHETKVCAVHHEAIVLYFAT